MATIRAAWMTVRPPTRHYSSIIHSAMPPPRRLAVVPPSRRDLALPLHLDIMTVASWVHGRPLALPVAPSSRDLTAVLLPLHLGIMTVTRRVHDGPLALPAPPPPGPANGSGARRHSAHPALLSTGAVSTTTPDIAIEGSGDKQFDSTSSSCMQHQQLLPE